MPSVAYYTMKQQGHQPNHQPPPTTSLELLNCMPSYSHNKFHRIIFQVFHVANKWRKDGNGTRMAFILTFSRICTKTIPFDEINVSMYSLYPSIGCCSYIYLLTLHVLPVFVFTNHQRNVCVQSHKYSHLLDILLI